MAKTDDPTIAALLRERDGYQRTGQTDRAAMVTDELQRRGYQDEQSDPHKTPPQGRTAQPPQETTDAEAGIVELREVAERLGVKVDGRWSAARLQAEIAKAQASK